jgi:parvulin-like peptidyl-prolyl isomerase
MRRLFLLCLAALLVAPSCGELLDPAAAVVHGSKITVEEISEDLESFESSAEFERLSQQGDSQELKRQVEQQLLSQEIRRAVLAPKAEDLEVDVTEEEIQGRLDEIKADYESPGAFEEDLKEQGLTLEQVEQFVADNLLEEELRAKVTEDAGPTEEDIQGYYDQNQSSFEETEAQHILVNEESEAADIARQLQEASEDKIDDLFGKLAKRFSTDDSNSATAGELGFFRPGDFVAPFEKAAAKLEIGEISNPVETEFGWHVIRVTDRRVAPLEDVAADIESQLGEGAIDEAWDEFVRKAYEEADVKVNPRYGEFDEETFQVIDPTAEDVPGAEVPETPATPGVNPTESPSAAS